jgi:hypothetical protein
MNTNPLTEAELAEILKLTQDGETQIKDMSDFATKMAEKWRANNHCLEKNIPNDTKVQSL